MILLKKILFLKKKVNKLIENNTRIKNNEINILYENIKIKDIEINTLNENIEIKDNEINILNEKIKENELKNKSIELIKENEIDDHKDKMIIEILQSIAFLREMNDNSIDKLKYENKKNKEIIIEQEEIIKQLLEQLEIKNKSIFEKLF